MVLVVADLPSRGRELSLGGVAWAINAVAIGVGGEVKAFSGSLTVTRHGVHLAVQGELHAVAEVGCARCGLPLLVSIGDEVAWLYSPVSTLPITNEDEDGLPKPPIDVPFTVTDVGEYDAVSFDVAAALTEWASIEAPARLRCGDVDEAEDQACTARFRAAAKTTPTPSVDPRFAILQNLKTPSEV